MRSHVGIALVITALGALAACSSSSGSPAASPEAGSNCTGSIADVMAASPVGCPVDANGTPVSYDEAITATCASDKLKTGDIAYGSCFGYLAFRIDADSTGNNFTECFYDVTSHGLVGVIYSAGQGQQQCGGNVDPSCIISGATGGGGFQSCAPVSDAGSGSSSGGGG